VKYILENEIPEITRGCETIEDIHRYLNTDPHPEHQLASLIFNYGGIILLWELKDKQERHLARLLKTCQEAYRKHSLDDSNIPWETLSDTLGTTLAEVMGDKEFAQWADQISPVTSILEKNHETR
jgi:hypothetical protein